MRLLPRNREVGWTPYVWLIYLALFFIQPVSEKANWKIWSLTVAVCADFLLLYFRSYWLYGLRRLRPAAGMALLFVVCAPWNFGALVFLIYAAATAGFTSESLIATKALAVLVAIGAMEAWFLERGAWFWILVTVLPVVIGVLCFDSARRHETNRRLRAAQRELEELARIAERERIARDLHDVLGHSLSVVILKSELASKLIGHDSARAEGEIRDVERIFATGFD